MHAFVHSSVSSEWKRQVIPLQLIRPPHPSSERQSAAIDFLSSAHRSEGKSPLFSERLRFLLPV